MRGEQVNRKTPLRNRVFMTAAVLLMFAAAALLGGSFVPASVYAETVVVVRKDEPAETAETPKAESDRTVVIVKKDESEETAEAPETTDTSEAGKTVVVVKKEEPAKTAETGKTVTAVGSGETAETQEAAETAETIKIAGTKRKYEIREKLEPETYLDEEGTMQTETEATLKEDTSRRIQGIQKEALGNYSDELDEETGTYNLLLIGLDRRDDSWYGNSDVMVLVTVNEDKETVYLTSFLRDLYANIPEVGVRKLNASCAYGGANLCVDTITSNYGVEIDNYAMVDFDAMIGLVDALGGVDLELTEGEVKVANDYVRVMCGENGDSYEEHRIIGSGKLHLDGYQTVGYMRNRYSGDASDFGRTERQRKVLEAILEKAADDEIDTLEALIKKVLPYVTHDISAKDLLHLITKLPTWIQYSLEEQHIPYDDLYHSENEILIPDMEETIRRLRETLYSKEE